MTESVARNNNATYRHAQDHKEGHDLRDSFVRTTDDETYAKLDTENICPGGKHTEDEISAEANHHLGAM